MGEKKILYLYTITDLTKKILLTGLTLILAIARHLLLSPWSVVVKAGRQEKGSFINRSYSQSICCYLRWPCSNRSSLHDQHRRGLKTRSLLALSKRETICSSSHATALFLTPPCVTSARFKGHQGDSPTDRTRTGYVCYRTNDKPEEHHGFAKGCKSMKRNIDVRIRRSSTL